MTSLPYPKVSSIPSLRNLALVLGLLLAMLIVSTPASQRGDFLEYAAMTIAIASHGTPDLRGEDVQAALELGPAHLAGPVSALQQGMRENREIPLFGFNRGHDGRYYAIHFFGYSALAALPFKLLQLAGLPPYKCFQIVNLGFVFILGLSLLRLFGSTQRALLGVGLFMLCGGFLYWNWCSPETMSAAALLAGLVFFSTGAPLLGGLLAGLAAMQNPPIVFFAGFAPLLLVCQHYRRGAGLAANLKPVLGARYLLGMAITAMLFAAAPLFSLWQFGVPSLIAKYSTRPDLIGLARLHSFFFDLNQGMIIGIPGLLAALGWWAWRVQARGARLRGAVVLAASAAFALALALPALAAMNWNSDATGMMRYAFWCAMPLLFALLWYLRQSPRWPLGLLLALVLVQSVSMGSARSYGYTEFSPLAAALIERAPRLYNPDPEIFFERNERADAGMDSSVITQYRRDGVPLKTLYNERNEQADATLCGPGQTPSEANDYVELGRHWRYINGPVRCASGGAGRIVATFGVKQFKQQESLKLAGGWNAPELGGGNWDGVWSDGPRSRLTIALGSGQQVRRVTILGHYVEGNKRTRVAINGIDLGWQRLDKDPVLDLPEGVGQAPEIITIELQHEAPYLPPAKQPDQRQIAFFLHKIILD